MVQALQRAAAIAGNAHPAPARETAGCGVLRAVDARAGSRGSREVNTNTRAGANGMQRSIDKAAASELGDDRSQSQRRRSPAISPRHPMGVVVCVLEHSVTY